MNYLVLMNIHASIIAIVMPLFNIARKLYWKTTIEMVLFAYRTNRSIETKDLSDVLKVHLKIVVGNPVVQAAHAIVDMKTMKTEIVNIVKYHQKNAIEEPRGNTTDTTWIGIVDQRESHGDKTTVILMHTHHREAINRLAISEGETPRFAIMNVIVQGVDQIRRLC
jgi:hypothetical protein